MPRSRLMSTVTVLGVGAALALGSAPASALPTSPSPTPTPTSTAPSTSPSPTTSTASSRPSSTPASPTPASPTPSTQAARPAKRAVPPFPGVNASEAQLEAWSKAVASAYHLPAPPATTATPAQRLAYLNQVMLALGAPSQDASPEAWQRWFIKTATGLGFPTPPAATAGDDAWAAWFQKAFGIDLGAVLDSLGTDAILSEPYCVGGVGHVDVEAVNLSSSPALLKILLDSGVLKAKISLPGSSESADEPSTYSGDIRVPNGRHTVSVFDVRSGETLDSITTDLRCGGASALADSRARGPVVQTDALVQSHSAPTQEGAWAAGLVMAVFLGFRRFARR